MNLLKLPSFDRLSRPRKGEKMRNWNPGFTGFNAVNVRWSSPEFPGMELFPKLERPGLPGKGKYRIYSQICPIGLVEPYDPTQSGRYRDKRIIVSSGKYVEFFGRFGIPFDWETEVEWGHPLLKNLPEYAVVEFEWKAGKLTPVRQRPEKPYPNNFEIIEEIWGLLRDPITRPTLEGYDFSLLRKYHNQVKSNLYKTIPSGAKVLEIGFGQAGDLDKLIKARVSEVLAIEPDAENVEEAKRRISARSIAIPIKIINKKAEDVSLEEIPEKYFDSVNLMLCLSHFDQKTLPKVVRLIDHALKVDGRILIFTIDGASVSDAFQPILGHEKTHQEILDFGQVKIKNLGEKINIFFPGAKTVKGGETTGQEENLFSFFSFYKELPGATLGYTIETFERATGEPFLPACQYSFSRLYTSSIMKKMDYAEKFKAAYRKKKGKEIEEEEEEEIVEDAQVRVAAGVLGKVRILNIKSFWDGLLEAFSSTYSKLKKEDQKKEFIEKFVQELATRLAGPPQDGDDVDEEIVAEWERKIKTLNLPEEAGDFDETFDRIQEVKFKPESEMDVILTELLLGVYVIVFDRDEDKELKYLYARRLEAKAKKAKKLEEPKKAVLFLKDKKAGLQLIAELVGDKYKTLFLLDDPSTKVEKILAKKLGRDVEDSESEAEESEESSPEKPSRPRKKKVEESEEESD